MSAHGGEAGGLYWKHECLARDPRDASRDSYIVSTVDHCSWCGARRPADEDGLREAIEALAREWGRPKSGRYFAAEKLRAVLARHPAPPAPATVVEETMSAPIPGPCNCATWGNASRCPHHTQEDFDSAPAGGDSVRDRLAAVERPPSLAEQLCEHVHPSVHAEQVFGACDPCKRYTLAVIESDWLADERTAAAREALLGAADAIQALHPGEVKNSVIFLRDRAVALGADDAR